MKFAHMADIHLGSWKEPKLRTLNSCAFTEAIDTCILEKVDFVLISGDLFNTSLPPIESLKTSVSELKKLKDASIPVYGIAGSHDFSPSGRTMLEILEEADFLINVYKGNVVNGQLELDFTTDKRTGAKITGIIGKKGMLEKKYYEELSKESLEAEEGFKIFMFHTALSELKAQGMEMMDSASVSLLPTGFEYYAGGHVHIVNHTNLEGYKNIVYPGPLFPNSFSELEKLNHGGFYIYDDGVVEFRQVKLCGVFPITVDCEAKTAQQATELILSKIDGCDVMDSIVLLRLSGVLETGKTSEIQVKRIMSKLYDNGAYFVMRNTSKLRSKEFDDLGIVTVNPDEAEEIAIADHVGKIKSLGMSLDEEKCMLRDLMSALDIEKEEGQRQSDHELRSVREATKVVEKIRSPQE